MQINCMVLPVIVQCGIMTMICGAVMWGKIRDINLGRDKTGACLWYLLFPGPGA